MVTQAGDKGRRLPISEGCRADASSAAGSTPMASRHVGRGPGLVNESKPLDVHRWLRFTPCAPRRPHVLALLLAGVQRFF
jgi:hypothetical protein